MDLRYEHLLANRTSPAMLRRLYQHDADNGWKLPATGRIFKAGA